MRRICRVLGVMLLLSLASLAHALEDWNQVSPTVSGTDLWPRREHAMAYIASNQVLLFGGIRSLVSSPTPNVLNDTWLYDLSSNTWTELSPTTSPPRLYEPAMAYAGDDKVLLFGGHDDSSVVQSETWIYDLSDGTWSQPTGSGSWVEGTDKPEARREHGMAYLGSNQVLLFGGSDEATGSEVLYNDTWIYDMSLNQWSENTTSTPPAVRDEHAMAYIGSGKVLLFGGDLANGDPETYANDTWLYDGTTGWSQQSPSTSPAVRDEMDMAYIGGGEVMMFGGADGAADFNKMDDTWVFNLSTTDWAEDSNPNPPTARHGHCLAETSFDGSSRIVLFGGDTKSQIDSDTWAFGGGDYPLGSGVAVALKAWLEGAYQTGTDDMTTTLQTNGDIPLTSPYSEDARTITSVSSGVTDWVLLQLRSNITQTVASRSCFLGSDGNLVDTDGSTTSISVTGVSAGDYYLVLQHRNHVAVMSASAQTLSSGSATTYDFSTGLGQYYGSSAQLLETGVYGLFTGDANENDQVQNDDKNNYWKAQVGLAGYHSADFNLNGQVQNDDKNNYWKGNVGIGTQVP